MATEIFGGIEAGGTKFLCGIGTGPDNLEVVSFPTTTPDETVPQAIRFFRQRAGGRMSALGIASFGPIDLDPASTTYGRITTTPKLLWRHYDFAGALAKAIAVPIGWDTDVNAAALAERRWGAAQDVEDCLYLTVGTGIGGGAVVRGRPVHGMMHPEMGHIRVPHDRQHDPFEGSCPFHGDCLEGLASGPAVRQRWGIPAEDLPMDHPAWALEAHYLALALSTFACTLSPQRIILGGGLMQRALLLPLIRQRVADLLNGYMGKLRSVEELNHYIVPPTLGHHAGLLGAILLAKEAWLAQVSPNHSGKS